MKSATNNIFGKDDIDTITVTADDIEISKPRLGNYNTKSPVFRLHLRVGSPALWC